MSQSPAPPYVPTDDEMAQRGYVKDNTGRWLSFYYYSMENGKIVDLSTQGDPVFVALDFRYGNLTYYFHGSGLCNTIGFRLRNISDLDALLYVTSISDK